MSVSAMNRRGFLGPKPMIATHTEMFVLVFLPGVKVLEVIKSLRTKNCMNFFKFIHKFHVAIRTSTFKI